MKRLVFAVVGLSLVVGVVASLEPDFLSPARTQAQPSRMVYWTDWGSPGTMKIQRAGMEIPTGQTASTRTDVEELVTGLSNPSFLELDSAAGKMYWGDYGTGKIQRADLDGGNVEDLATGLGSPDGVGLNLVAGKVYWEDSDADKIEWANVDGTGRDDYCPSIPDPDGPFDIAFHPGESEIYWANSGNQRINKGCDVDHPLVSGLGTPSGMALDVDAGKMYWGDYGTDKIQRADLDGGNVEDVCTGLSDPQGIALDVAAGKVYWAESTGGRIRRANMDPPCDPEDLITAGAGIRDPHGIALDIRGAVGGVAELPEVTGMPVETGGSSAPSAGLLAGVAAGVALGIAPLAGAAWWARRRWHSSP